MRVVAAVACAASAIACLVACSSGSAPCPATCAEGGFHVTSGAAIATIEVSGPGCTGAPQCASEGGTGCTDYLVTFTAAATCFVDGTLGDGTKWYVERTGVVASSDACCDHLGDGQDYAVPASS